MSLTEAQVAQVVQMLEQAGAAKRQEAMSSMTSFERFLDRNGLSWVLDKISAVINVLDWLAYIFS
jgi:hypothetical protein